MYRYALTALVLVIIPKLASGDPTTLDVFTSFEFGDLGPTFGASPVSATFVGGASVFEAVPSLYHHGSRSWRIDAGTTTTIDFETPVSIVEFFALDVGTADAVVTAFSPGGTPVGSSINLTISFPGPMNDFSNPFSFSGLGPIGSLDVNNPGGGDAYVDSFGFSAVPDCTLADLDSAAATCNTIEERNAILASIPALPGDLNGDGFVNFNDFLGLSANFGTAETRYDLGNVDLINGVNFNDFLALSGNFGKLPAPLAATAAVPEPASLALLGIGGLLISLVRRRHVNICFPS